MNPMTKRSVRAALLTASASLAIIMAATPAAEAQTGAAEQTLEIPAGALRDALFEIAQAFDVNVLADDGLVAGKTAPSVSGALTAQEALDLALAGSGLSATRAPDGDFLIGAALAEINDRQTEAPEAEDRIIVTGTRIERTAVNSPAPIDIVTAEDIAKLGLTDTTEALRFVPALNTSVTLSTQGNFRSDGPQNFGLATLNLRGLGTNRTLVLINGRRHVSGVSNEATVDISSIPTALVDRVEVLTGGGSSIYGADAVSGVVNYVLKDDFEGVDYRGNVSVPTDGDGEAYFGALTMGGNFADGRGNAVLNVEYNKQTDLRVRDRSASLSGGALVAQNNPQLAAALGVDPDFLNVVIPNARLSIAPFGPTISFTGDTLGSPAAFFGGTTQIGGVPIEQIVDPVTGEIRPRDFGSAISPTQFGNLGGDGAPTFFQNPVGSTIPDLERYFINAFVDYDFSDKITGFVEAKYSRNSATSTSAFAALQAVNIPVQQENPFIPELIQGQFDSLSAQGLDPNLVVTRFFFDEAASGPNENIRDTFRIVGGFKGELSSALGYEVSANYGRTDISTIDNREPLIDRFYAAADVVADPITGAPICRSDNDPDILPGTSFFPTLAAPGFRSFVPGGGSCSPLNIFAQLDTLNPETVDFIFQRTEVESEIEQLVVNATLTGDSSSYFSFPAGEISYAAGFEYREERSETRPDALQAANLGRFQTANQEIVGGEFDVFEGFAEVNIPILADLPMAQSLSIDASVRVADYSTVGTTTSFAAGAVWRPLHDLRIRGSFNRSVRAPNIAELFSPQTVFLSNLRIGNDPCDPNSIMSGTSTRAQNCAQLVPDLATFDPTPSYTFGSVLSTRGGNPDLDEETADTYTIGFVFTPEALPGLAIVADYYNIEISDAIGGPGSRAVIVASCADAPTIDNPFCDAITRNPSTGVVEAVQETILNIAEIRAQGIDYQVQYRFDLDNLGANYLGSVNAQIAGAYLIEREDQAFADFPESSARLDGSYNFPKHFLNFGLGWEMGSWSADYGFNFQSNQIVSGSIGEFAIEEVEENPLLINDPNTGSAFVHYIGGAYQVNDKLHLSLRVNNLTNQVPFSLRPFEGPIRPVGLLGRTVQFGVQGNF